jgi:transcriptional regulator GlxA family with amidase domain
MAGEELLAHPGDMLLPRWDLPRRESHRGDQNLLAHWVSFSWIDPAQQAAHLQSAPALSVRRILDAAFVRTIFARMIDAHIRRRAVEADSYLAVLLTEFSNAPTTADTSRHRWTERIQEVCLRIQEEPGHRWTVSSLAAANNSDSDHFSKMFRVVTGLSPAKYIINTRLDRARELLLHGGDSIKQIAESLGYFDQYAFSRQFKRHIGVSPSAYRSDARPAVSGTQ